MDPATISLLRALETSRTDLRKLVLSVELRRSSKIEVAVAALARWERDDPNAWAAVRAWLAARDVEVLVGCPAPARRRSLDLRG